MEDKQIIALFLERDERALTETEQKYGSYCRKIADNILSDKRDSEEAVSDALMGVWRSIPPNIPERFSAYIGRLTRNASLKIYRRNTASKRSTGAVPEAYEELEGCISGNCDIQSDMEAKELAESISRFLYTLKENERKVFVCRYWYFDSISDISERFGFSTGKVKSMLFRTRKKLFAELKKEGLL